MAYLKVRPDRLDDTRTQLANDHLIGASPRGWEDISNVLAAGLPEEQQRLFVQGRIGAANAAEFFGVLRELRASVDVERLLAAAPGADTQALLPRSLDSLYGMIYGLLAVATDDRRLLRILEIVDQYPDMEAGQPLPVREAQTLTMELLIRSALERGLEQAILESPYYARYLAEREGGGGDTSA